MNASYWIQHLNLQAHPEGGHYRETYRSKDVMSVPFAEDKRNVSTAIYYMLQEKETSQLHRIKSDELWFYHAGNTLEIIIEYPDKTEIVCLGKNIDQGEQLQCIVPANVWFGARVKNQEGYVLVSCTVAPGFDFRDFELKK